MSQWEEGSNGSGVPSVRQTPAPAEHESRESRVTRLTMQSPLILMLILPDPRVDSPSIRTLVQRFLLGRQDFPETKSSLISPPRLISDSQAGHLTSQPALVRLRMFIVPDSSEKSFASHFL